MSELNVLNLETRRAYSDRVDAELVQGTHPPSEFICATALVGKDVCNRKGESLGELKEIVLDTRTGGVAYAVLSCGGILGIGCKLFAVPWKALRHDTASKRPLLDVEKGFLERAPSFVLDPWPDMADAGWASQIHSYYGIQTGDRGPVPTI